MCIHSRLPHLFELTVYFVSVGVFELVLLLGYALIHLCQINPLSCGTITDLLVPSEYVECHGKLTGHRGILRDLPKPEPTRISLHATCLSCGAVSIGSEIRIVGPPAVRTGVIHQYHIPRQHEVMRKPNHPDNAALVVSTRSDSAWGGMGLIGSVPT